jgi:hypothetical protein
MIPLDSDIKSRYLIKIPHGGAQGETVTATYLGPLPMGMYLFERQDDRAIDHGERKSSTFNVPAASILGPAPAPRKRKNADAFVVEETNRRKLPRREDRREDRAAYTEKQIQELYREVADKWRRIKARAGRENPALELASPGNHGCSARIIMNDGRIYSGKYGAAAHAEMEALKKVPVRDYARIERIEIEKEPCPRCAFVLNKLRLAGKVTYKVKGQKNNAGWLPPWGAARWNDFLGLAGLAKDPGAQRTISLYFASEDWWLG